mmetsp:Transcript_6290/g.15584  ORF Transcript_6290/g.15584 Transcript_6290/m.15584 type:complete len:471 (+) Transcript_6290:165-1577(+)
MPEKSKNINALKHTKRKLEKQNRTDHNQNRKQMVRRERKTHHPSSESTASESSKSSRIMRAFGHHIASPVVESMNVNAILDEVDWNEVLDKVDINEVIFDRIDVNRILARVDVNRHLARVDFNRHLDRVDWDAIVEHSNLEEIISRSTTGVVTGFLSLVRTRVAWIDQWVQRLGRCFCCKKQARSNQHHISENQEYLPPRPGRSDDSETIWENPGTLEKRKFEKAIQFRTCGGFNRLLYLAIDQSVLWCLTVLIWGITSKLTEIFTNDPKWWVDNYKFMTTLWVETLIFLAFAALYWIFLVGCFGRTIGMSLLGLLMVSRDGRRIGFAQVLIQVFLIPLNLLCFGWVAGFIRRDGNFLSDIIGGVTVVYAWEAKSLPDKNPEIALSIGDYATALADQERKSERKSLLIPESLDVELGADDYNGDDDVSLGGDSEGGIEIAGATRWMKGKPDTAGNTNLEDGASRWSKENI